MDRRVRKLASHSKPETAAFVADLNVGFGEQEIDEARRSALHRRHGLMSGQLTAQCATVITELAATATSLHACGSPGTRP